MIASPLTARQQEILSFIADFHSEEGYPPTVREIGEKFGIASPNGVQGHLDALEEKGAIARSHRAARGISIIGTGAQCPHCGHQLKEAPNG